MNIPYKEFFIKIKAVCPYCMDYRNVIRKALSVEEDEGFSIVIRDIYECQDCKKKWAN